jgi:hypothetical protein
MTALPPILFLVFNRPKVTRRVFAELRRLRPPELFIAADGPRGHMPGEAERCRRVREVVAGVDWPCRVSTLMREENLGCGRAVSSAVDWFFSHVEEGIVLEDDCLPHPSFFEFCGEMLARYRNEPQVMHVSGDNFQDGIRRTSHSYYFSKYPHCWGWATWRRAWELYDFSMSAWERYAHDLDLLPLDDEPAERAVKFEHFSRTHAGEIDTWDYQWTFTVWRNKAVTILPEVNLVENIGIGPDATHTKTCHVVLPKAEAMAFPLRHPERIERCREADAYFFRRSQRRPPKVGETPPPGAFSE